VAERDDFAVQKLLCHRFFSELDNREMIRDEDRLLDLHLLANSSDWAAAVAVDRAAGEP
jgi:hypothetical protein